MARTVDPARHEARRLHIIDAALTVIAERGYEKATTAAICREATIGSGTFFHYFPTKADVLLAILRLGTREIEDLQEELQGSPDPFVAIETIVERAMDDALDPRIGGFVRAVASVMGEPDVARALEADERAQSDLLQGWISRAQRAGSVRTDLPSERLTSWVRLLLDGFLERSAIDGGFAPARERPVLRALVFGFLTDHAERP